MAPSASSSRMVTSSRRAGRITNKTRLLIYRGSSQVDLEAAETIVWDQEQAQSSDPEKHQPVGAKGVDSSELLEHHLQAALSSASLLHFRSTTKPSSPTQPSARKSDAAPAAASTSTLNYHIPTPDASGLIQTADYAKLYQIHRWSDPTNYIKFSDTVEESCLGTGGLGYCMDDEDVAWLASFNGKAEGGSGELSPLREKENIPLSAGRERRTKGKEKEKEVPASLHISEDIYEYVMGVLEKWTEDNVPKLHTDLSKMPTFQTVETLFSSPIAASFYPSHEVPRDLPDSKTLLRTARNIFPHWKERKERREGRSICPSLNYDETNDGDPYVCFRRRDIRATRKTRRTDNYSVEKMQKIQFELKSAYQMAQMVVRREKEKKALYKAEKEVWEAKWKLYETKRRWPSLGMTKEEEEIITGKQLAVMTSSSQLNMGMLMGNVLHPQSANVPLRKRTEREKEDRDRRDRIQEQQRQQEKAAPSRYYAPEEIKARMLVLRQKLEEELSKRKELDVQWDDQTDSSYQPLPTPPATHAYRALTSLDPFHRSDSSDEEDMVRPASFRLRRGRGGIIRLDRRQPVYSIRRGAMPSSPSKLSSWLFPDRPHLQDNSKRPKSIDDVQSPPDSPDADEQSAKRRKLDEQWRYDASRGGCTGLGMGVLDESDRIVVDDLDPKYIRSRINLLQAEDLEKLRPDVSLLREAWASMDIPPELPPAPIFMRPAVSSAQVLAAQQQAQQQQQLMQQQQAMEYQRFQMMAQQQAAMQQQAAVMAQAQQQMQAQMAQQQANAQSGQTPAAQSTPQNQVNGLPQSVPTARVPSDPSHATPNQANAGTPSSANAMPPPAGTTRPNMKRPPSQTGQHSTPNAANANMPPPSSTPRASLSPNNAMHMMQLNGQAQQVGNNLLLANGMQNLQNLTNAAGMGGMMLPNGAPLANVKFPNGGQMPTDPAVQQQLLATIRAQAAAQARSQAQANGNIHANGLELDPNGPGLQINGNHIASLAQAQLNAAQFQLPNGMQFPNGAAAAFANAAIAANGANGVATPAANGHAQALSASPTITVDANAPIRIPSGYEGNKIPTPFQNQQSYDAIARAAQAHGFPSVKAYIDSRTQKKKNMAVAAAAQAAAQAAGGGQAAVNAAAALAAAQQQQQATNQQIVAAMAQAQVSLAQQQAGVQQQGQQTPANGATAVNGQGQVQGQGTGQNFDGSPLPPTNMQLRLPTKATNKLANQGQTTPQQQAQRA